jgi:hypothetical protein
VRLWAGAVLDKRSRSCRGFPGLGSKLDAAILTNRGMPARHFGVPRRTHRLYYRSTRSGGPNQLELWLSLSFAKRTMEPNLPEQSTDEFAARVLKSSPKTLGVMLVSAGALGVVLPGPGVPALVAGGLILWPKGFAKAEGWLRRKFPEAHRASMSHIGRFLNDLERRYPGSLG